MREASRKDAKTQRGRLYVGKESFIGASVCDRHARLDSSRCFGITDRCAGTACLSSADRPRGLEGAKVRGAIVDGT